MASVSHDALLNVEKKTNTILLDTYYKETNNLGILVMQIDLKATIEKQRKQLELPQPELNLVKACKLGEGLISFAGFDTRALIQLFRESKATKAYFIPASGSGSRMFQFLFEFIEKPNASNGGMVERFLNHIEEFACFQQFPREIQNQLLDRTMELEAFASFILNNKGYGLAHLPKALIPFHKNGPFLLNPIHEHVLQGSEVAGAECVFHFTIQEKFKSRIEDQLQHLEGLTSKKFNVTYSVQNPATNAIAFDQTLNTVLDDEGNLVSRPAGHGALLENFANIKADLVFIKNIDNIQHFSKANKAIETQQILGGIFLQVSQEIQALQSNFNRENWVQFLSKYQLFSEDASEWSANKIHEQLARPLRVCGMVKNEGQPGGGPFWIEKNGTLTKQIVEKSQISAKSDQVRVMIQSSHFNPVMMVCQGINHDGSAIDFEKFRDHDTYFKVNKTHQGKDVQFIEMPGLWNGSMAYWNSVFVEIPSETFSPVKTILDLLESPHTV
jgi:hypothetical protein